MLTYRRKKRRSFLVAGHWSWIQIVVSRLSSSLSGFERIIKISLDFYIKVVIIGYVASS
ncbi:hypothetical protein J8TS2_38360 [Lederbergia ruris]|uniref:Uncharacterized protein n=1 Tax=Lederbergia ruris TaxID=217495 RepID=A0ABQ4KNJ8_9BACI|nr:hypothetical protein J8TS2_38360 [Lederbergia ruris]